MSIEESSRRSRGERTRMAVPARRAQLLDIGVRFFATRNPDDVRMEDVAGVAGVSKALVYHYFPGGVRELYISVVQREADRLLDVTRPDPQLPPLLRLRASFDAFLEYVETHPDRYRSMVRANRGTDDQGRLLTQRNLGVQLDRMLDGMPGTTSSDPGTRVAIQGWLSFLGAALLEWLDNAPSVPRDEVRDICLRALAAAIPRDRGPRG
jgi:AcrR family transcriptional regulator